MCVKPLSKIYDLTDKFTCQYMTQAVYLLTATCYKINSSTWQVQSIWQSYSPLSMSELKMKRVTSMHGKPIATFVRLAHSATHKITHCRKQISSINDMSWQVFPLLILQGDNHRSLTRLWFSLHKTRTQSIRPHPPQHRNLSNTVLFNSNWQEKKHYMP